MENTDEIKQIAAQILSSLLANPHIYSAVSDEGGHGRQEQELIAIAIDIARCLITKVDAMRLLS